MVTLETLTEGNAAILVNPRAWIVALHLADLWLRPADHKPRLWEVGAEELSLESRWVVPNGHAAGLLPDVQESCAHLWVCYHQVCTLPHSWATRLGTGNEIVTIHSTNHLASFPGLRSPNMVEGLVKLLRRMTSGRCWVYILLDVGRRGTSGEVQSAAG